ncbi:hypothetical protein D9M73_191830 [compost metagenome]
MRAQFAGHALLAQGQALLHAETVLFVDDRKGQVLEPYLFLEQRVGADHHGCTVGDLLQGSSPGLALEFAG